jgi:hypothetical protein
MAALEVLIPQQLPESLGFVIQAALMLRSSILILLGVGATLTTEAR